MKVIKLENCYKLPEDERKISSHFVFRLALGKIKFTEKSRIL